MVLVLQNKTNNPLAVKLPDAFVGTPALAQMGGGRSVVEHGVEHVRHLVADAQSGGIGRLRGGELAGLLSGGHAGVLEEIEEAVGGPVR